MANVLEDVGRRTLNELDYVGSHLLSSAALTPESDDLW
jgi:hypothetical protein